MSQVFVLKRLDNDTYYQGSYQGSYDRRFSPKLSKAKKYKRSCDAANALTCMRESGYAKTHYPWLNTPGNFVIQEYEMALVNERYL